jgi:hypothetical protein
MRERYGWPSAEALAERGAIARRTMFVDGYGNDVVAISFIRARGRSPIVEIAVPREDGEAPPDPLIAAVSQDAWWRVLAASETFDKQLVEEQRSGRLGSDDRIELCLHGWMVVAESIDPGHRIGERVQPHRIRRDTEGSCADGLAVPYSFALADLALASLAECGSLDPLHARNKAALLALCQRLGGDRLAAAEAERLTWELERLDLSTASDELRQLFTWEARDQVEPFREALIGGQLYLNAPRANDPDNAEVTGQVGYLSEDEGRSEVADVKLRLVRDGRYFVIESYELSERRPLP